MQSFYPMVFEPLYKEKIWGGRRLSALFQRQLPPDTQVGESWEIVDRPDAVSVIAQGDFKGMTLKYIRETYPEELYGECAQEYTDAFPLLFKFIDAEDDLSLQVHPDDKYARQHANDSGKHEAWYIVDAMPNAQIIRGFRAGITKDKAKKAWQKGSFADITDAFNVEKDDVIYIPPNTVHAIGAGIVLAEIQQNSDVTYRIYDYDRANIHGVKRTLHVDDAFRVMSFSDPGMPKIKPVNVTPLQQRLMTCDHFSLYRYDFREPIHEYSINRFRILCNISGFGTIISPEGLFEDVEFFPGTTILMPAAVKDYSLVPATHCVMLDIIPGKYMIKQKRRRRNV